ncbi:hypothetical protein T4A_10158 [Trichinella pseudospiralis]|uniref:Uncharacterized protein n=1 Tax=Trichinella pseudospiralis TaxID=6337 RepID=A0A0V1ERP1_TRIPS|nr:hypothetical protein T4A_10158 [Trichinella pseudospiralis]
MILHDLSTVASQIRIFRFKQSYSDLTVSCKGSLHYLVKKQIASDEELIGSVTARMKFEYEDKR